MPGVRLREHQVDATARIRTWAGFPARSAVPAKGARATLVSATGSGKTITAATAALDLFRDGRILVMVPTLDLLVQTAQAWRTVGHRGPMVGVCSLQGDEVLERLGVRTTTNPIQLALWAGAGPVVVLATYASLVDRDDPEDITGLGRVRGPLEAALAGGDRLYGQRMRGFDLAVVDEAHGTAGDLGRAWAAIHDNARIPVSHRLYMTATPRILAAPRPPAGKDGRELEIASMSDDPAGTYGQWIYELGLSEAVERGILAGFEIDVLEIQDPDLTVGASEEAVRGRRLALLQTALLEHAAKFNLRTVMTFHQRVEEAAAFTAKLPETAAELYASEVTEHARAEAQALPASSIGAQAYELTPTGTSRPTACGPSGCAATTSSRSGARPCTSSRTASTLTGAGCTGRSSPACGSSAKASTSPANAVSKPSASPTPAAPKSKSSRTSAAPYGPTPTARPRPHASSCPSSWNRVRTRTT